MLKEKNITIRIPLPCRCGGTPLVEKTVLGWKVFCVDCGRWTNFFSSEAEAINNWDLRFGKESK